ncbi:MAG: HK97 family phage prohead protease [Clostridia bacterium]|nr:HK97 family phage prohead protease [Clostridia bacterium]
MEKREIRYLPAELRAEQDEERGAVITGYPVVFEQETDLGFCREVIDAGAAGDGSVLRDVALLANHDWGMIPLARSRRNNENSTMKLSIDQKGIPMRAVLDTENNPKAKEAYSAVSRGDITGMSFAFTVNEERWTDLDTEKPLRRIMSFGRVFEVSLVTDPAYKGTSVQAADESSTLESVKASLESARKQLAEERAAEAEKERRTAALDRLEKLQKEART